MQVYDDNNRGWSIPPGNTQAFNPPNDMYGYRVGLTAPDTSNGYGSLELYDVRLPVNTNNSVLQEPGTVPVAIQSGSVTILGSPVVTIAPGQSVIIAGTPTFAIAAGSTVGITGTVNAAITGTANIAIVSASIIVGTSDATAQGLLSALQGLLPQTLFQFTFTPNTGPNAEQTRVLTQALTQFSVSIVPNNFTGYDGVLWIFYIVAGKRFYLENKSYWAELDAATQPTQLPHWTTYHEYIPNGATFGVGYEGYATITVRI